MRISRHRLAFGLSAIFILICLFVPKALAQDTDNFKFDSFSADYFIGRDNHRASTLSVAETLIAVFPDYDQNHGILRAIPQTYQGHSLSLKVTSVTNENGTPLRYTTYKDNDNLVLKIGDVNRYVHGRVVYKINYQMRNTVLLLNDHDEFYWDVNGDQWPQPFSSVSAKIYIPAELTADLQDRKVCFSGVYDQKSSGNCQISAVKDSKGAVVDVSAGKPVRAYQTLSFATAFNKGTFTMGPEVAREALVKKVIIGLSLVAILAPPLAAGWFMFRRWQAFGNDPKGRGVIIPEYVPPKGFNVLQSDFMLNQRLSTRAISAAIVQLATMRIIKINEIIKTKKLRPDNRVYELEIVKETNRLPNELRTIIGLLFDSGAIGEILSIGNVTTAQTTKIAKGITALGESLANSLYRTGYFIKDPKKVSTRYYGWGIGVLVVGGGLSLLVLPLGIGVLAAGIIVIIFARIMPARTEQGVLVYDQLLGLKDYIKMAEADRIKFGQSPEGSEKIASGSFDPSNPKMQVKLFETLLPYAILFGLEKDWAKQFEDIYKSPPDWYSGNVTKFNSLYLASSLSNFSAVSMASFAPPSSSSGSGFSGGFSGGGGGGGGGGGW